MKKLIISILFILVMCTIFKDRIVIPKESIRIRVIANSNSSEDQKIKNDVKKVLEGEMYNLLKDTKKIDQARLIVGNNLENIDKKIADVLSESNTNHTLNFGYNYFPSKEYKGITYKEGMYESLVVTLGSGKGDNWWCVMFPPFCLLEAYDNDTDNIEYHYLLEDLINDYLDK